MDPLFLSIVVFAAGWLAHWLVVRNRLRDDPAPRSSGQPPAASGKHSETPASSAGDLVQRLYKLVDPVETFLQDSAHPQDLLTFPDFEKGASLFAAEDLKLDEVADYATGDNVTIACMALEGLSNRPDAGSVSTRIAEFSGNYAGWSIFFVLRYARSFATPPFFGHFLTKANDWWVRNPIVMDRIRDTVNSLSGPALEAELTAFSTHLGAAESSDNVRAVLDMAGDGQAARFREMLNEWEGSHTDVAKLATLGSVWDSNDATGLVEHADAGANLAHIESELVANHRSVMLVGERGVGKTAVIRLLAAQLQRQGWIVFETPGSRLMAGNVYMGQLEKHLLDIVAAVRVGRRVLWVIPAFHEIAFAGRHKYSPTSVLDLILPHVEKREVLIAGETTPAGLERIQELQPRAAMAFEVVRVAPLDTAQTLAVAEQVTGLSHVTVSDALQLARQHLANLSEPGNVLHLLDLARQRRTASDSDPLNIGHEDLIIEVARATGLPRVILDDSHQLDLDALRQHFNSRVVGQPEAIQCLVDRVAMIKAGLTDPTQPYGVFLFAGPTGIGKTEIAKTLAAFLFGSEDRMIRFDMSEFQTAESLVRLYGESDGDASSTRSLVRQIRENPFSILLLDEFEKAHPRIWDTFLQVFDEGRLTDRKGNVASFRHCIIIMTSNLGAAFGTGPGIGFDADRRSFSKAAVEKAVTGSFRSEFLNRIDRVVVFQPLSRASLRTVLQIELSRAFERRGLRSREWAVEWDNSAIEFLLDRGFSAELGARPLKRAVERYLLSPLAQTIVEHEYPEGDQFLFIRSTGDSLDVQFVDPDAPLASDTGVVETPTADTVTDLRAVALHSGGTDSEFVFLCGEFERLRSLIQSEEWEDRKDGELAAMEEHDFWQSEQRFEILSDIEYMDRIQSGLDTAGSLIGRMSGSGGTSRKFYRPDLLERLAQQVYLIDAACGALVDDRFRDAFLSVEATGEMRPAEADTLRTFALELAQMYLGWADKRRMRVELQDQDADGPHSLRVVLAISGFGAYPILESEAGFHVMEIPKDESSYSRLKVRVRVVGQPASASRNPADLRRLALASLEQVDDTNPSVIRRYRREPSPLVRDASRGWRTGNLEQVLAGDFDLITM